MGELGMFGLWMFIAAIVISDTWYKIKKREANHETARRLIESGQEIDEKLIESLLDSKETNKNDPNHGKSVGIFVGIIAIGVFLFSLLLGFITKEALFFFMGSSFIVASVGVAIFVTALLKERRLNLEKQEAAE